jgi:hypothetical protein
MQCPGAECKSLARGSDLLLAERRANEDYGYIVGDLARKEEGDL